MFKQRQGSQGGHGGWGGWGQEMWSVVQPGDRRRGELALTLRETVGL